MKIVTLIARILLGLVFFGSGLMGLLGKLPPQPPGTPEKLLAFFNGLMASGYFMPLLKGTETICGLLLLTGAFVPLALVVLAPIVLNILLVHTLLDPSAVVIAVAISGLEIYLAFFASPYKEVIRPLFACPNWLKKNKA